MEVSVSYDEGFENCVAEEILIRIATTALKHENAEDAEMSILMTGQEYILELNN